MADPVMLSLVRRSLPDQLADEICSVQPMDSQVVRNLLEGSESEAQLRADGFKPISRLGLLWVKD
jgi:hypothetical protein